MSLVTLTEYKLNLKSQNKVAAKKKANSVLGCCVLDKQGKILAGQEYLFFTQV